MALSPKMIKNLKRKVAISPKPRIKSRIIRRKTLASPGRKIAASPRRKSRTLKSQSPTFRKAPRRVGRKPSDPRFTTKWQIENQSVGIGPLKRNELGKYGYSTFVNENKRDSALHKAVQEYGALSVFRKLNAVAVYNKNRSPRSSEIAKKDRDFVKQTYM